MAPENKSYSSRGQGFMFRVIFLVLVVLGLKEVVCNLQEGSDQGDIIRDNYSQCVCRRVCRLVCRHARKQAHKAQDYSKTF